MTHTYYTSLIMIDMHEHIRIYVYTLVHTHAYSNIITYAHMHAL